MFEIMVHYPLFYPIQRIVLTMGILLVAKIQRVAKENEKSSGIYSTSGDQAREFADQGFNMVNIDQTFSRTLTVNLTPIKVSVMTDMVALPTYMKAALKAAKGSYVQ